VTAPDEHVDIKRRAAKALPHIVEFFRQVAQGGLAPQIEGTRGVFEDGSNHTRRLGGDAGHYLAPRFVNRRLADRSMSSKP
jgi:hypothetical protein